MPDVIVPHIQEGCDCESPWGQQIPFVIRDRDFRMHVFTVKPPQCVLMWSSKWRKSTQRMAADYLMDANPDILLIHVNDFDLHGFYPWMTREEEANAGRRIAYAYQFGRYTAYIDVHATIQNIGPITRCGSCGKSSLDDVCLWRHTVLGWECHEGCWATRFEAARAQQALRADVARSRRKKERFLLAVKNTLKALETVNDCNTIPD